MSWEQIIVIASPVFLGIGFIWLRVEKVTKAVKEIVEALNVTTKSIEDKEITAEELSAIKKEWREVAISLKNIFS